MESGSVGGKKSVWREKERILEAKKGIWNHHPTDLGQPRSTLKVGVSVEPIMKMMFFGNAKTEWTSSGITNVAVAVEYM